MNKQEFVPDQLVKITDQKLRASIILMVRKTSSLLLLTLFSLAACRKEVKVSPEITPVITTAPVSTKTGTIPDKAELGVKLFQDSLIYDGTMLVFDSAAGLKYNWSEDALYFYGFGKVGFASISSDGRDLAINTLPYKSGLAIGLDVHAKTTGAYFIEINYEKQIPANIGVWLKDYYLKDSVDLRVNNYRFNVIKTDTNSFGNKRFMLILKDGSQQQTATLPGH